MMKTLVATLMLIGGTAGLQAQGVDQTLVQTERADFSVLLEGGCEGVVLNVMHTRTTTEETRLNYLVLNNCTAQIVSRAFGVIPNEDFKVTGKGAHLSTMIVSRPDLTVVGLTGFIELDWVNNGTNSIRSDSNETVIRSGIKFMQHTNSYGVSADVNGAVVGIAINGVVGSTGTSLLHDLRSEKQ